MSEPESDHEPTEKKDEENPETEYHTRQEIDVEKILDELGNYIERRANSMSKGQRIYLNLLHMVFAVATQGAYLLAYIAYHLKNFRDYLKENDVDLNREVQFKVEK